VDQVNRYHENPAINAGISCRFFPGADGYLISDGGSSQYRYRVRPPSFINLTVSRRHVPHTMADVMVVPGSIDIVMGEVDR